MVEVPGNAKYEIDMVTRGYNQVGELERYTRSFGQNLSLLNMLIA